MLNIQLLQDFERCLFPACGKLDTGDIGEAAARTHDISSMSTPHAPVNLVRSRGCSTSRAGGLDWGGNQSTGLFSRLEAI